MEDGRITKLNNGPRQIMDRQKKLNTKPDGPARSWRVAGSGCPGCHTETYQAGGQRMPQDLNMLIKLKHITKLEWNIENIKRILY